MAKLKVTRADGSVGEYPITPLVQYGFEMYAKKGFHKAFIETLTSVEVLDDDPLA